ncbi:hypothetical protein BJX76DRAFT_349404 [Aspergillus varians]
MSRQIAPKQIFQKKQISKQEYSFREEWAPETIKDYQIFPNELAPEMVQQQQQHQQPTQSQSRPQLHATTPVKIQGRIPNRRSQVRSSSLFEEWKAKALRNSVQTTEPDVSSTGTQKGNYNKPEESTTSNDFRGSLRMSSDKAADIRAKTRLVNDGCGRQSEASKTGNVSEESHIPTPLSGNTSGPAINAATSTRKKGSRRGRKQCDPENQQRSREHPQHSKEREQSAYTAPNGTRIGGDELRNLAVGFKLKRNDKAYFLPCFIEDPWKDLKHLPSIRPPGLMSRFRTYT